MEDKQVQVGLRIAELISAYLNADLNNDESAELSAWLNSDIKNFEIFREIANEQNLEKNQAELTSYNTAKALEAVKSRFDQGVVRDIKRKRRWVIPAAAAAVLIMLSAGLLFYLNRQPAQHLAGHYKNDVAPGENKAILTLSDGKQVELTDAKFGMLARQGSAVVNKTAQGQITYNMAPGTFGKSADLPGGFNTITVPRGGQFSVQLPDGTKVWLNAASTLKYPTAFTGRQRRVELSGEAYFEVVHNEKSPFLVVTNGKITEDLGTHFNINAYPDEQQTKTTLLEGSVRVSNGPERVTLKPGQQSQIKNGETLITVLDRADIEGAVAWKNGYFKIDNEGLKEVMRNVARWYDVDVEYKGDFGNDIAFLGEVSRNKNISVILKIMEATGSVHFRVEGRRVTVMP